MAVMASLKNVWELGYEFFFRWINWLEVTENDDVVFLFQYMFTGQNIGKIAVQLFK